MLTLSVIDLYCVTYYTIIVIDKKVNTHQAIMNQFIQKYHSSSLNFMKILHFSSHRSHSFRNLCPQVHQVGTRETKVNGNIASYYEDTIRNYSNPWKNILIIQSIKYNWHLLENMFRRPRGHGYNQTLSLSGRSMTSTPYHTRTPVMMPRELIA